MPGVLLDDQNFQLDTMPLSSFYEPLGPCPSVSHSQAPQLLRHNSFSGVKDNSSSSHTAPIYQRSQSAISSSVVEAFKYYSPPTTPRKSSDGGFSGFSILDTCDDYSSIGDCEGSVGGHSGESRAMSGNPGSGDFRSLAYGNSVIVGSPTVPDSVTALHKYLPSNNEDDETWGGSVVDVYACDQFRMFEFKVRRCMRGRSHDWTECPFAHPGEKARRRDPRRFHYSGTACPDFRKGSCRRGDACEFAHGVFECWLHPARYRTQPCKDGRNCRRRVCFFAHTPEQLRLLPAAAQAANAAARTSGLNGSQSPSLAGVGSLSGSYGGSPSRGGVAFDGAFPFDMSAGCVSHCSASSPGSCQGSCIHGGVCANAEQSYGGGKGNTHGVHCCTASQLSSPTSTLVGHSTSPPPLSPPLTPTNSPPMSPQSPHHWLSAGVRQNVSSLPSSPQSSLSQSAFSQASLQASLLQGGYSQGPCSPLSRSLSTQSAVSAALAATAACHAHTTQSMTTPAHRRHLDRLNSMPTLSIPHVDYTHRGMMQAVSSPLSSPSSGSPPSPGVNSSTAMSDLIATIQRLGLRGGGVPLWIQAQSQSTQYSSGPSPLRRCSQSVPSTPTKLRHEDRVSRWEVDGTENEAPVLRVESGRDLRAKIYGRLGQDYPLDSGDAPDLGWVSELVKDEQVL